MDEESSINREAPAFPFNQSLDDNVELDQWLFHSINRFVKGKVLEVGSGDGNISALFSQNGLALRISDPDDQQRGSLQKRFAVDPMIKGIHRIDLAQERFTTEYEKFLGRFDTLVSLNPKKFNFGDTVIWQNAKQLLRTRGRLLVVLSAPAAPYVASAEAIEEWYRWTRHYISKLLGKDGEIIKIQSFGIYDAQQSSDIGSTDAWPSFHASGDASIYQAGLYVVVAARKL